MELHRTHVAAAAIIVSVIEIGCTGSGPTSRREGCTTQDDCGEGLVCSEGTCVAKATDAAVGKDSAGTTCHDNIDGQTDCSRCGPGYLCVQWRYTGKYSCVYPCTSDAECACTSTYAHKCSRPPVDLVTNPGPWCHLQF